jgi:hypothetical protein
MIMTTSARKTSHKEEVRHVRLMDDVQLARIGVVVADKEAGRLQCMTCGHTWTPEADAQGVILSGSWLCPNRCNRE